MDQERKGLDVIVNGADPIYVTDPHSLILPSGGGVIVADGNVWGLPNGLSVSQFVWTDKEDRNDFIESAVAQGYACRSVNTKYAEGLYKIRKMEPEDAVIALYDKVKASYDEKGRYDSAKAVRDSRGDISFGQQQIVVGDFLRIQNLDNYDSDFMRNGIQIAWDALDKPGREMFGMTKTLPKMGANKTPNRIAAVLACTHDPATGERREFNGLPWGKQFIIRRVIGLSGMMRGTGPTAPGNPMRAVLRILGRRSTNSINVEERKQMDKYVAQLIDAFQQHPTI